MKWWQKKVRGWTVPFWYTNTPLYSKLFVEIGLKENYLKLTKKFMDYRRNKLKTK